MSELDCNCGSGRFTGLHRDDCQLHGVVARHWEAKMERLQEDCDVRGKCLDMHVAEQAEVVSDKVDPSNGMAWMRCSPGLPEYVEGLEAERGSLVSALREIESHRVAQNKLKGRSEEHSTTLRIVRAALAKAKGE